MLESYQPVKPLTGLAGSPGAAAGPWETGEPDAPHSSTSLWGRKSEEGREEFIFYLSELGMVWGGRAWCEMWARRGTHNLPYWKLQIPWNKFPFLLGRVRFCQTQAFCSCSCFSGWYLPSSRDLPLGVPNLICDIWDQECTFFCFPYSLTSIVSCFLFTCPKNSLSTAKEQVRFNVIWSTNFQVETLPLGGLLQESVLWSMFRIDHAYFTLQ